jgi:hypothetical protein
MSARANNKSRKFFTLAAFCSAEKWRMTADYTSAG